MEGDLGVDVDMDIDVNVDVDVDQRLPVSALLWFDLGLVKST